MKLGFLFSGWIALSAWICHGAEPAKVRFVTDWYPQPEHGGFYHALVNGYYKAEGLEVEILSGGPNVFALQRVASGAADFGMSNCDDILMGNDRGIPAVAVGATMQHDPQALLLHVEDTVRDWSDLEGRTIAMTPGTSWFPFLIKKFHLKKAQETPLTYSIATFLKDPTYIQQCFVTSEPFFVRQAGGKARVMLLSDAGFDPYRVFFTRRQMIEKRPEVVRGFVNASIRGWRDYMANPESVHDRLKQLNPEMTPEKMDFSYHALRDGHFIEGDSTKDDRVGGFLAGRWKSQFDTLKELGVIRGEFPVTNAWTGAFCNPKP